MGAGLAGLTCAIGLGAAGVGGLLLDKGRGPGGRLSTRRRNDREGRALAFDHGAQYFTVRDARFGAQVDDWVARGVAAEWDGRVVTLSHGVVGEPRGAVRRLVGTPAMQTLATDLHGQLEGRGIEARCSTRVERLRLADGGIVARLDPKLGGGVEIGPFERVCLALPAPQAAELLADLGPRATELRCAAAGVVMEPSLAALVRFEHRLAEDLDLDAAFVDDERLGWVARNASKPGRPGGEAWVLHSTAAFARRAWEQDPADWSGALLRSLEAALGRALPELTWLDTHRWGFALAREPRTEGCLVADLGRARIALAGDWCSGSRVEGAYLSGRAAATALLAGSRV